MKAGCSCSNCGGLAQWRVEERLRENASYLDEEGGSGSFAIGLGSKRSGHRVQSRLISQKMIGEMCYAPEVDRRRLGCEYSIPLHWNHRNGGVGALPVGSTTMSAAGTSYGFYCLHLFQPLGPVGAQSAQREPKLLTGA